MAKQWPAEKGQGPEFVSRVGEVMAAQGHTEHSLARLILGFLRRANRKPSADIYQGSAPGQTDASGNLAIRLFTVPEGCVGLLTRLVVEGSGYTPKAPYTADGWLGVFESDASPATLLLGAETSLGMLRDFRPTASGGIWLPALFTAGSHSAWAFRAGASIVLNLSAGPASKQISASFRVQLVRDED